MRSFELFKESVLLITLRRRKYSECAKNETVIWVNLCAEAWQHTPSFNFLWCMQTLRLTYRKRDGNAPPSEEDECAYFPDNFERFRSCLMMNSAAFRYYNIAAKEYYRRFRYENIGPNFDCMAAVVERVIGDVESFIPPRHHSFHSPECAKVTGECFNYFFRDRAKNEGLARRVEADLIRTIFHILECMPTLDTPLLSREDVGDFFAEMLNVG